MKRFKVTLKSDASVSQFTWAGSIDLARRAYSALEWDVTESEPETLRLKWTGGDYSPSDLRKAICLEQFEAFMKRNGSGMSASRDTDGTYREARISAAVPWVPGYVVTTDQYDELRNAARALLDALQRNESTHDLEEALEKLL